MNRRLLLGAILRKLVFAGCLVFLVTSGSLLITHLAPGDATTELRRPGVSEDTIARQRERLGLERPFAVQYVEWMAGAMRLDLGRSSRYGRPVIELLGERVRNTALLATAALAVATVLGVGLGVAAGHWGSGAVPLVLGAASIVAVSVPSLLASLLLALMAARTGWFPVGGMTSVGFEGLGWAARLGDVAWHLTLPAVAVAIPLVGTIERLQSQALSETLAAPWVRAAVARGLSRGRIVWGHALPVAIRPVLGVYGIIVGSVFSGSFVVEVVTAWPGLGQLMYEALVSRDTNLVAGCALAGASCLALGNMAADIALVAADPRLRTES
jgi:peptide/nickel transport system permease protein